MVIKLDRKIKTGYFIFDHIGKFHKRLPVKLFLYNILQLLQLCHLKQSQLKECVKHRHTYKSKKNIQYIEDIHCSFKDHSLQASLNRCQSQQFDQSTFTNLPGGGCSVVRHVQWRYNCCMNFFSKGRACLGVVHNCQHLPISTESTNLAGGRVAEAS